MIDWPSPLGNAHQMTLEICVDTLASVDACARAGADVFVSGTTLFGRKNLKAAVRKMRKIVTASDPALADLSV